MTRASVYRRLPWPLAALTATVTAAALALAAAAYPKPAGETGHQLWFDVALAGILLSWGIIGALVASRRPENPIGWLFLLAALGMSVSAAAAAYAEYSVLVGHLPAATWMAWLTIWLFSVSAIVAPVVLFLIFPDGRFLSRRWRGVTILILLAAAVSFAADALAPGPIGNAPTLENPLGTESQILSAISWSGAHVLAPFVMVFVLASLIVRLKRSRGDERTQIKWVVYAAAIACSGFLFAFVRNSDTAFIVALVGLAAIPVAAGLAILHYRLYEIDRVVNRTVVYGVLTAGLAGLYFGIVIGLQQLFSGFTRGNDLAIAGSTLAVAALFRPARSRIQRFVDRRFYRGRYDAERTLAAFSARLRDEIDLGTLGADLSAVVRETMQPAHVSLWLREPDVER